MKGQGKGTGNEEKEREMKDGWEIEERDFITLNENEPVETFKQDVR